MAVELCPENSGVSPRISFSHDLCLSDVVPVEPHPLRSNSSGSSIDFDFCVRKSFDQDSSSADELFSDGKILPTEIKKKSTPNKSKDRSLSLPRQSLRNDSSSSDGSKREMLKETKSGSDEAEEKQSGGGSRSFWGFKRSSSLNCGSGYGRSLCPLPLLSRSNSTGSTTPGVKRSSLSKDQSNGVNQKQHQQQQHKQSFLKSSSSQSTASSMGGYQKPPLKKNYGNVVRVNPVLNVASGNFFGFGPIFSSAKDKNNKKK